MTPKIEMCYEHIEDCTCFSDEAKVVDEFYGGGLFIYPEDDPEINLGMY